jgi:acyl carrier protein
MLEIVERAKAIVVGQLCVEPAQVVEAASFVDDLGADSLDTAELAIKVEREFGFQICDEAAESIRTVGDAVKFIGKYTVARSVTAFVCMRV